LTDVQVEVSPSGVVQVNVHEAKTHLSRLLRRVEGGEEIVIARNGCPVVRLVPFRVGQGARLIGRGKADFEVRDDFEDPLPERLLSTFEK
jgi:prevent-host-death family protein